METVERMPRSSVSANLFTTTRPPRSPLDHEGIFLRASTKARGVQINDVTVEILNDLAIRYDQLQDEDD